jgi:hypothetical protein
VSVLARWTVMLFVAAPPVSSLIVKRRPTSTPDATGSVRARAAVVSVTAMSCGSLPKMDPLAVIVRRVWVIDSTLSRRTLLEPTRFFDDRRRSAPTMMFPAISQRSLVPLVWTP